jgi:hypothetical protein
VKCDRYKYNFWEDEYELSSGCVKCKCGYIDNWEKISEAKVRINGKCDWDSGHDDSDNEKDDENKWYDGPSYSIARPKKRRMEWTEEEKESCDRLKKEDKKNKEIFESMIKRNMFLIDWNNFKSFIKDDKDGKNIKIFQEMMKFYHQSGERPGERKVSEKSKSPPIATLTEIEELPELCN